MAGRSFDASATSIPPKPSIPKSQSSGAEIIARHELEPHRQGALDKLCGLYSAINALRLGLAECAPVSPYRSNQLFEMGIGYLRRKKGLHEAATSGMEFRRRAALTKYLAKAVSNDRAHASVERPEDAGWRAIDQAFDWIEESLTYGKPVLIAFMGGLDHYSVVSASTPSTLQLFDSTGIRFVRKRSCGLREGFHRIPANGLLRIAVHRSS